MYRQQTRFIGLFLLLLAVSILLYFFFTLRKTPTVTQTPIEIINTYTNSVDGFSIAYPKTFTLDSGYGYQGFGPQETIRGVSFVIPLAIATGTNLGNDSYISVEHIPKITTCTIGQFINLTQGAMPYTIIDGGISYLVASSTDAGAGNRYEETVYVREGLTHCYAIRYFIQYGAIENYPKGLVVEFDKPSLLSAFDTIRRSLVITQ